MKISAAYGLAGVLSLASVSVLCQSQRLQRPPPSTGEAPPIVQARGSLTPPQERGPAEPFGNFLRGGVEGAADGFGKAYKKKIDKTKITGPLELTVDHLTAGPDRFLEFVAVDNVVPGATKIGVSSSQTKYVRLHFKPYRSNVPHLLLWHVQNFHASSDQTYVFKGSGVDAKFNLKGKQKAPIGIIVIPTDMTPLTITVSASTGYWWRFYGVEVSMLSP